MSNPVRFHLSLNVSDLTKSVAFFRVLFGMEPAKLRADYAKFEPDDPPLVLSLEPSSEVSRGGALNHLGFRLPDAKTLVAMQERLERAGMSTKREEGVECCYAKQTKFWAHDPDGNLWEVYTFEGDIDHRGEGQSVEAVQGQASRTHSLTVHEEASASSPQRPPSWEHRMNEPVPAQIPHTNASVDEVRLLGTLNLPLKPAQRESLIAEVARVLRPGGRLFVHVLAGESEVENPELPGPAGAVRAVPFETEPVALLEDAGFVHVRMMKFDAKPCFVRGGVGMRELQLEGFAPPTSDETMVEVMYRGPFQEVRDGGREYARGRRVAVPATVAAGLQTGVLSGQFVVFEPTTSRPSVVTACHS